MSRTFVAGHVHRWLAADVDGARIDSLCKSEPHLVAVLELLPILACQSNGEELRQELLSIVPELYFPNLLKLDIAEEDKLTALRYFLKQNGRLPNTVHDIWDFETSSGQLVNSREEIAGRTDRQLPLRLCWYSSSLLPALVLS